MRIGSVFAPEVDAALKISRERLAIRVKRLQAVEADALPLLLSVLSILGARERPCADVLGGI